MRHRQLDRVRRDQRHVGRLVAGDVLGQFQMHRPRPLLHRDAEGLAHHVGMVAGLTICRAILVSGRIVETMSTIWNRACRLDRMPFCPVSMIIGMAPSCA